MSTLKKMINAFIYGKDRKQMPVKPKRKSKQKEQGAPVPILQIGYHVFDGTPFCIDSKDFLSQGERDGILASSGMGKSYLTRVKLEEVLERSNQVVFIMDPEREWWTLKERYDNEQRAFKVFGSKGQPFPCSLRFTSDDPEEIQEAIEAFERRTAPMIRALITGGVSAVFDFSSFGKNEQCAAYSVIADAIFKGEHNLSNKDDGEHPECRKIRVWLDEAHVFAPQKPSGLATMSLKSTEEISKRGRKRNIHLGVSTQRPASINKDILSQCNRLWLGGITSSTDFKPNKELYNDAGLKLQHVQSLKTGEFIYCAGPIKAKIKARKALTRHGGETKKESTKPILDAKAADEALKKYFY